MKPASPPRHGVKPHRAAAPTAATDASHTSARPEAHSGKLGKAIRAAPESLRLRGVRQNNLKGFDLDLPLGKYIAVTGLSGSGKSSLVFDTLHAEGQRRYVETFSAYTRQFLELLPAPKVDSIENIRPSIAIEQTNTVKTSRSTVGTMTELCDYFKVWFAQHAQCFDPETGEPVEDDSPASIWHKTLERFTGRTLLLCFAITRPSPLSWGEILQSLKGQGYLRVLLGGRVEKIDALLAALAGEGESPSVPKGGPVAATAALQAANALHVIQDRLTVNAEARARFLEAAEAALHFGQGQVFLFNHEATRDAPPCEQLAHFSKGLHSPSTGRRFRAASPALFSFNSPLGACPRCRGFGRVIEVDYRLAIPDHSLSIEGGAIKCWESDIYGESKKDLLKVARRLKIPTRVPFAELSAEQRDLVVYGEPGYNEAAGHGWPKYWYGLKGFFDWLEKNTYKMHVRVFLSRYRAYNTCPDCHGARLQPEALCWRWQGKTLPELYQIPISELLALLDAPTAPLEQSARTAASTTPQAPPNTALSQIRTRLRYLEQVGLGYLTLDRSSRTLSGGEVERVNLTSCLGSSLVDTLFVLDEPSVGLHPRDIDRLIEIIRSLTAAGNTVVVVEHDEAMIRAADHVVEIGPEAGSAGGHLVFQGSVAQMLAAPQSLSGAYFSGRRQINPPRARRPVAPDSPALHIERASKHNLREVSLKVPLQRFVALSGVSGSGKSTLLNHVIYHGLLAARGQLSEEPATIGALRCDLALGEVVLVDQSPLARTPRSNPALYCEAWDEIRALYAATPAAQAAGLTASSFSFNSGDGRCEHCQGRGYEKVEMQFLSDVFVPCPVCEGRRFKPETLAIRRREYSVADLLETSIAAALPLFVDEPKIHSKLRALDSLGLGYLTLGQPLNTLSGGEAQRLKLLKYLSLPAAGEAANLPSSNGAACATTPAGNASDSVPANALLLLDEPTTGLHPHDIKRLLKVLQSLVDLGHSVIVIEHNLDVLKSADWIIEVGPEAGRAGGQIVAAGPPEKIADAATATSPFLRQALGASARSNKTSTAKMTAPAEAADSSATATALAPAPVKKRAELSLLNARENNLKNLSLTIPHHALSVVTGVSGSGKSTLAFDIIFAEGQRRFMESMSAYARQFVEQLPRPAIDSLVGIPPTVAIEQRVTRGSRKSTVATITEVAQYLRLLYARLGVQHHPETGRPVTPLSAAQLRDLLARFLKTPEAQRAQALYLCAPLIRGRKGHHQPIATWIGKQGFALMRADGRVLPVAGFEKLDRYREHDIEAVVADLKNASPTDCQHRLDLALKLGKGSCFVLAEARATHAANAQAAPKRRAGGKRAPAIAGAKLWLSTTRTDAETGESFPELDPKHFSFNSPRGWCPTCRGHGVVFPWMLEQAANDEDDPAARLRNFGIENSEDIDGEDGRPCPDCHGTRLNRVSRSVRLHFKKPPTSKLPNSANGQGAASDTADLAHAKSLPELLALTASELLAQLAQLELDARGRAIAQDILPQIEERLKFLDSVGLGYLSLDRATATLSGGEAQRIRLAAQLGSNLSGVLYVLDEPSIGLHARDNDALIETLQALRAKHNTLLVVEHDDALMERADHIIDLGPAAGIHGGELLASGTPAQIKRSEKSLTGLFLKRGIPHPTRGHYRELPASLLGDVQGEAAATARTKALRRASAAAEVLELKGATLRNLQGVDLRLPLGRLTMVAGPSGAGKSTLFRDILHPAVGEAIRSGKAMLKPRRPRTGTAAPAPTFAQLNGAHRFKSVIEVDQSPIGKTPRSTPATYLGIFDLIRQFFASLPEAKMRGYSASRFSFNTAGGRCETCAGAGRIKLEMAFMPATYLPCEDCGGSRYARELAEIQWKGKSIGQVLQMSFEEAVAFFDFHSRLREVCQLMVDCGLGYLCLGQSSPTLSGGEAQRLKLVTELVRGLSSYREKQRGQLAHNLYILEEPSIGLHLSDCEKLIGVLHSLVEQGHTVVVIEHHLDLLAEADYLVEIGPGGGPDGGQILYQGELAGLLEATSINSPTAPYLRAKLKNKAR